MYAAFAIIGALTGALGAYYIVAESSYILGITLSVLSAAVLTITIYKMEREKRERER